MKICSIPRNREKLPCSVSLPAWSHWTKGRLQQRPQPYLLSFEKDHSLHFGINILTQLPFKFFPSIANVWHFSWAPQGHGHRARFGADQGALVYRRSPGKAGQGCSQAFRSALSATSCSADLLKWPVTVGGTESRSLMASLLEAFIISVAEGTTICLNLIPAFCSAWADWYSLCW